MDLRTRYMGLELSNPILAGASPLTTEVDVARKLEDQGVAGLVMHSLFEEKITREELSLHHHASSFEHAHAEAASYLPPPVEGFSLGPDAYLEQIAALKKAIDVPVIASLNGVTPGGWVRYAALMQQAGADALELNVYHVATDPDETSAAVEQRYLDVLVAVKAEVTIPVAMKLSPYFSAPLDLGRRLAEAGADALVLFNRFYQPDIDIDELDVVPALRLSDSNALRLRLRWLAAMFGHFDCSLAATGGVHDARDVAKALMAGANAVQMTSGILREGPGLVSRVHEDFERWAEEKEYESVGQMIGSMSLERCPDPAAFERANYMKVLQSWKFGTFS